MKKTYLRPALIIAGLILLGLIVSRSGLQEHIRLESLKSNQEALRLQFETHPVATAFVFLGIYIFAAAISLPGATVLTLAGGAIFGIVSGTVLVSFASTIGATLAFLVSRFLLRDFVQSRFKSKIAKINQGVESEGAFYLFTLRLVPVFPFFLINLVMGLTPIRVWTFFWVSQVGMLAGTLVYVNAGTQLAKLESLKGILSPQILGSFVLIGILPLLSRRLLKTVGRARHSNPTTGKPLPKFAKPKSFDYNMVVIGAGSGGLVTAYLAAALKAKVALVEKHRMGGDCLNTGCVPSKALIRSARAAFEAKQLPKFGLDASPKVDVDLAKVMDRVHRVIAEIAPHDSVERYSKLGVECIQGEAKVLSPYEVLVNGRVLTSKNLVIATGASPLLPPIPGLADCSPLTSDSLWQLRELPQRLLVLGGGPIGCELAQAFARLGSSVTVVEGASRLLSREDEEVSNFVKAKFEQEGLTVKLGHLATRADLATKSLVCEADGKNVALPFDQILVALGRKANVKGFGLEELGLEVSKNGTLAADEFLRSTNYQNIYLCGDVTGPYQFTHTAAHQAWYAAVNALFSPLKKFKADYRVIPWCTFTDPEVARVGLSEQEAREKQIEFEVTRYGIDDLDRAITDSENEGFVKVLTKPGSDEILGATIVGRHAGEMISEYILAMKHGLGLNKILGTIHIYPTFSEANKFAAGVWKRAHAPAQILNWLGRFHAWRRS